MKRAFAESFLQISHNCVDFYKKLDKFTDVCYNVSTNHFSKG